jgi:hypothetical protein
LTLIDRQMVTPPVRLDGRILEIQQELSAQADCQPGDGLRRDFMAGVAEAG